MELLYIYIKEYECFKNVDFHFSNRYKFELKSNELSCTLSKEPSIGNFWGDGITNLSVIVGDNGAGKTTLLRCIMECISYEGVNTDASCIFAFFDKKSLKIKVYTCGDFALKLKIKFSKDDLSEPEIFSNHNLVSQYVDFQHIVSQQKDKGCLMPELKENKIIYMNNALELSDYMYKKSGQLYDLSIGGLIRHDFSANFENHHIDLEQNMIINHFNNEIYRQLDFLYSYKENELKETIVPFEMPTKLTVTIVKNKGNLEKISESLKKYADSDSENLTPDKQSFYEEIENLVYMINKPAQRSGLSKKQKWVALIVDNIYANALKEITVSSLVPAKRNKELSCFMESYQELKDKDNEDILKFCNDFFNSVQIRLKRIQSSYENWLKPYKDFIEWLVDNYERINFTFSKIFTLSFEVKLNEEDKDIFEDFFNHYRKTCFPFYYLNFSWGLSSGEYNLLSMYARLYSALKSELNGVRGEKVINYLNPGEVECKNILLLIDEADLSYHPDWQSKYIKSLLNFLPTIYKNCDIQVILTTHSPIMLSDVPKSNVIYLKHGNNDTYNLHQETFGQNIYTLFDDAFYFEKSENAPIIGKFAQEKIKEVFKTINEIEAFCSDNTINDISEYLDSRMIMSKLSGKSYRSLEYCKYIVSIIGELVIKAALEAKIQKIENQYRTEKLKNVIKQYNDLSKEDKENLIDYIINKNSQGE